ncbi:MAG: hypothetical protein AAF958_03530 [Planctomycetota bacterium]
MNTSEVVYSTWSNDAIRAYFRHADVSGAWSNIILGVVILMVTRLSLRADQIDLGRRISAMTLFFASIFCVNVIATMSHMIEHYPPIATTLRMDLDFVNHSAIGFCALWVEVSILERVRGLRKIGYLRAFPKTGFVVFVVGNFVVFQAINWSIRNEPNFNYAILDYMLSLSVLLAFCVYVLVKLPRRLDRRYEAFSIASFGILASASIAHIALADLLPVGESLINANDVYHLLSAPAFYTLYKSKRLATSANPMTLQPNLAVGLFAKKEFHHS